MDAGKMKVLALQLSKGGGDRLRELIEQTAVVEAAGFETAVEEFERKAIQLQPPLLVIEYDPGQQILADMLGRLRRTTPNGAVIAVSKDKDPDSILGAMRQGVREYLVEPVSAADFNAAVLRLKKEAGGPGQAQGPLIVVMGVKGGVGASHLAINLAWSLSQKYAQRIGLIDLDLGGGDLSFLLDMEPKRTMSDLAANFDSVDSLFLDSLMSEVAPGLRLLAAPTDLVAAEEIAGQHISRALEHLIEGHSMVVADAPSRLNEASLTALDASAIACLVMEPTIIGLKAAKRMLTLSQRLGYNPEKLALVVNRADAKGAISRREMESVLKAPILASLPNDSKSLMEAANAGIPVLREYPRSNWAKAVNKLAGDLMTRFGEKA